MDVATLVTQMQDTLSRIHHTLASLDQTSYDSKIDELEKKRDTAIQTLSADFAAESDFLDRKRKALREEIAERRRREDEELAAKERQEDEERNRKLQLDKDGIEEEIDSLMCQVEREAQMATEEGQKKLRELENRRRVSGLDPNWRKMSTLTFVTLSI
jgi:hypothetical protein